MPRMISTFLGASGAALDKILRIIDRANDGVKAVGLATIMVLAVFIGLGISGCSGGGSSSTGSSDLPVQVDEARAMIRPYYPESAELPLILGGEREGIYASYSCKGFGRLYDLWFELYSVDPVKAACVIRHEGRHAEQVCTEKNTVWRDIAENEGYAAQEECVKLLRSKGL